MPGYGGTELQGWCGRELGWTEHPPFLRSHAPASVPPSGKLSDAPLLESLPDGEDAAARAWTAPVLLGSRLSLVTLAFILKVGGAWAG